MKSIRINLILIMLIIFMSFLVLSSLTYWYTREIQGDGTVINLAGRQRMLSQFMAKEALEIRYFSEHANVHEKELKSAMALFEQTLNGLIYGDAELNIPPTKNPMILNKLNEITSFWNEFKTHLVMVLNHENIEKKEFLNAINFVSESEGYLLEKIDSVVKMYEMESNKKVNTLLKILSWSIPIVLMVLALGWVLANRWVFTPVVMVSEFLKRRKTLEDYRKKIPFHFNNEIGIMINSINEAGQRIVDVTDSLKVSEARYRGLIDHAVDAVISIDKNGIITLFNISAERIFGYKKEEAIGMNITELMPPEYRERHTKGLERFLETGEAHVSGKVLELNGLSKSGEIISMSVSIWEQKEAGVYNFTAILRDAREAKRKREENDAKNRQLANAYKSLTKAHKEVKETQSQLLQSEKMASIGQLAAGVAHEINNPIGFVNSNLSVLSGYVQDIKKLIGKYEELRTLQQAQGGFVRQAQDDSNAAQADKDDQDKIRQELDDLIQKIDLGFLLNDLDNIISESQEGTERVKKIVKDLKDFSHVDESELKYTDINKGLESTLNIIWNEIKYKATVIKEYGKLPEFLCYPMQLNQVFMNILLNAAQAIEKKGEIKIVTSDLKKNAIEIRISDTGTGISKENIEKIFNPFFTTKEVGKGTGLGLSMAYGIVKNHGGMIEVKSEVGKGSTFIIKLPVRRIDD